MRTKLDETDRRLLNLLQSEFPLTRKPFVDLASGLGLDEQEVIERVLRLREKRIIRFIGPVFNSRAIGYQSTLVAMRVPSERIEQAAKVINQHSGVSHNYQRDHHYNLWFTLATRRETDLHKALEEMEREITPKAMVELPALQIFKIRLFFDLAGSSDDQLHQKIVGAQRVVPLQSRDKAVINELQQNLPLTAQPFEAMSRNIGMETEEFLSHCRSLMERGIMRRFGATLQHRNAGFTANALVCWAVPHARVDEVGQRMAVFLEVTHCYERQTSPLWPRLNMFTMIHGRTRGEIQKIIAAISRETGIEGYEILPTVREFKKERLRYLL